jgi:hypothetical protein
MTLTQYGYHDRCPCVHKGHLRLSYISYISLSYISFGEVNCPKLYRIRDFLGRSCMRTQVAEKLCLSVAHSSQKKA